MLRAYQRRTQAAEALIASACLSETNTRAGGAADQTQTVLPAAETAAMMVWAEVATGPASQSEVG